MASINQPINIQVQATKTTLLDSVLLKLNNHLTLLNTELSFALACGNIDIVRKKREQIRKFENIKNLLVEDPDQFLDKFTHGLL